MPAPIYKSAVDLLNELGITEPEDLDVEAIAHHCKAIIVYKPLSGCAARITGNEEMAIITIDSNCRRERQRFSAGHELGHWMHDRGKSSMHSCKENAFLSEWSKLNPEARANRYASDLLLPEFMFKPRATALRAVNFKTVKTLAKVFETSLTATAIRLVERGPLPAMFICSTAKDMWFIPGDGTKPLFPKRPNTETHAHEILSGADEDASGEVLASAWFDHPLSERYYIEEHSIRGFESCCLTLLWWKQERMLIDLDNFEESRAARKSW